MNPDEWEIAIALIAWFAAVVLREDARVFAQIAAIRMAVNKDYINGGRFLDQIQNMIDALIQQSVRAHLNTHNIASRGFRDRCCGSRRLLGAGRHSRSQAKLTSGGHDGDLPDEIATIQGRGLPGRIVGVHGNSLRGKNCRVNREVIVRAALRPSPEAGGSLHRS
jgi:hypothetical protein